MASSPITSSSSAERIAELESALKQARAIPSSKSSDRDPINAITPGGGYSGDGSLASEIKLDGSAWLTVCPALAVIIIRTIVVPLIVGLIPINADRLLHVESGVSIPVAVIGIDNDMIIVIGSSRSYREGESCCKQACK
jgi:hypothetical protein